MHHQIPEKPIYHIAAIALLTVAVFSVPIATAHGETTAKPSAEATAVSTISSSPDQEQVKTKKAIREAELESAKQANESKREAAKQAAEALKQQREQAKQTAKEQKERHKEQLSVIKDEKRLAKAEKVLASIQSINTKLSAKDTKQLVKLEELLTRISTIATTLATRGADVTKLQSSLEIAMASILEAKAAVAHQEAKTYDITLTDETKVSEAFTRALHAMRDDQKAVRILVRTAHEKVRAAHEALKAATPSPSPTTTSEVE